MVYPTKQQAYIWLKRKQHVRPYKIANELNVSRPFVSKAQRIAEARINKLLLNAASINRIEIRHINTRYGIAVGFCPAYDMVTYILYSPKIGVQTWFDHHGDCGTCDHLKQCIDTLQQLAEEWEIPIPDDRPPTDLSRYLFDTIMRRLKWVKEKE
ncbi:MAG: hypothetical protein ACFFF4_04425 [Candidatus Thorarchaeota archaeon]